VALADPHATGRGYSYLLAHGSSASSPDGPFSADAGARPVAGFATCLICVSQTCHLRAVLVEYDYTTHMQSVDKNTEFWHSNCLCKILAARISFCVAYVPSTVIKGIFLPNFQSDRYHILQLHQPQGRLKLTWQTTSHFEVNSRKQHAKHAADHILLHNLITLTYVVLRAGLNVHLGALGVQP